MNTDKQMIDTVDRHFAEKNSKGRFKCDFDGCTRTFDSPVGLRMHRIRGHIRPWSTTGNFGTAAQRRKRRLEKMRIISERTRQSNMAKGLTGSGYQRKTSIVRGRPKWKSAAYRHKKYREQVERYHAAGLNAHGQPFKNNKLSLAMQKSMGIRVHRRGKSGRMMPFVYPVPGNTDTPPNLAQSTEPKHVQSGRMHFCPNCGEHLAGWKHNTE